jgi:hypothetical protein
MGLQRRKNFFLNKHLKQRKESIMAFGDIGGPVSALIITCKTPDTGEVQLQRGDAVKLTGPYVVSNVFEEGDQIFGQVMADCSTKGAAVPVRVRGICDFPLYGQIPQVDGISGVIGATEAGEVVLSSAANAVGRAVKVNAEAGTIEVLL